MIALIDNYDSFTFNLHHLLLKFVSCVEVFPHDQVSIEYLKKQKPKALVISPGPGHPTESHQCQKIINSFYEEIPILGVCLGMQIIATLFEGECIRMSQPSHGVQSELTTSMEGLFSSQKMVVGRYHSLHIPPTKALEKHFYFDAFSEDQTLMAIRHKIYPLYGVQFHPESILTLKGGEVINNFFNKDFVKKFGL